VFHSSTSFRFVIRRFRHAQIALAVRASLLRGCAVMVMVMARAPLPARRKSHFEIAD
jgi:hypothetical protein